MACEAYDRIRTGDELDLETFQALSLSAGRLHYPHLLLEAWNESIIGDEVVTGCVGPAWCAAEFPDRALPWTDWESLFDVAGFTVDGRSARRPNAAIRLYRAAPQGGQWGHSWTERRDVAAHFLTVGYRGQFTPVVWCATVEPSRLLARLEDDRAGEPQYVVETSGLAITAV